MTGNSIYVSSADINKARTRSERADGGAPVQREEPARADPGTALRNVTLDDKYDLSRDRVFITGTQAIIRLLLMQRERDRLAGLSTAGFVSGYRGSPIGGLDQNLFRAKKWLEQSIVFQPGLNEELAATAVWGSQQAEMRGEGKYDGVFGMWYGKGPGVDRSGDVFRHANMAGSSNTAASPSWATTIRRNPPPSRTSPSSTSST